MTCFKAASVAVAMILMGACHDAALSPTEPITRPSDQPSTIASNWGSGWIYRDGIPIEVHFAIRNGRGFFEGDIDLGPIDGIARTREELVSRKSPRYGVVIDGAGYRWQNRSVYYVIAGDFPDQGRVYAAIDHIRSKTAVMEFYPRTNQSNYIRFQRETNPAFCGSSQVGLVGGEQAISIADSCNVGTVIHEIGHALGFWHEQSRCDRDNYVEILWQNIIPGHEYEAQFNQHCAGASDVSSYEEGSIMHYNRFAFTNNGQPTIRSLRGLDGLMGQRDSLARIDAYTIDWMYPPPQVQGFSISYPGSVPTLTWNASRAVRYDVDLVIMYEEYDDYNGTYTGYDYDTQFLGSTTESFFQDTQHPNTGTYRCILWSDINGNASYTYWYSVQATFFSGFYIGPVTRVPTNIAPSSC
jgi:hypothetical protein